jgi:hypothetical protein
MEHRRPDTIIGYTHPEKTVRERGTLYKTFTEGKKPKKKEKFGNTNITAQYSSLDTTLKSDDLKCPECSKMAVYICNCGYSDKRCCEGHTWYCDRDGKLKTGNPH